MNSNFRILANISLILISFLLFQSNSVKEIFIVIFFIIFSYNILYGWIVKRSRLNPNLYLIYSFSYIISFILVIYICNMSIQMGTQETPVLPGDSLGYFQLGMQLSENKIALLDMPLNYVGYPLVLSWIFKLFGVHLIYGLLLNMILLFANIFLISESIFIITKNSKDFQNSFIILLFTSAFFSTGFMLLKDCSIVTAITLSLYSSLNLLKKKEFVKNYFILIISVIIMALFRFTFVWVPILIFVTVTSETSKLSKLFPVIFLIFIGVNFGNNYSLKSLSLNETIEFAFNNDEVSKKLETSGSSFLNVLISNYDRWTLVKKVLFIPVTTSVQYVTPFNFYDFKNSLNYPHLLISKNYNIFWFIFIGPLLLFSILRLKHLKEGLIKKITYLGILLYIIPAFIFGGAIPRYAVPFYSLLVPIMTVNLGRIKSLLFYKNKWYTFILFYFFLLICFFSLLLFFKA